MTPVRDSLLDMLEYIQHIETFTADGRDAFFADVKTQMAVVRAYEVIGQIAKDLPTALLDTQPQAEWKKVKGFRDFLAHNYEGVILSIVWGAVEKLPMLRGAVETLIASLPPETC